MDPLRNLIICKKCKNFLDCPIRLPCNKAICNKHVDELKDKNNSTCIKCEFCGKLHEIAIFEIDEDLNDIITKNNHLNEDENKLHAIIKSKKEKLNAEFKILKTNHDLNIDYVYEKIKDIKGQIDLDTEKLKKRVDDIREKLFKEIDTHQEKCNEVIQNVKLIEKENMITNENERWKIEKFSKEIKSKQKFESNLDSLINQIESDLSDMKTIKDSLEKIEYISNEVNLNTFYKSDQFLGDLRIPKLTFKTEKKEEKRNEIKNLESKSIDKNNMIYDCTDLKIKFNLIS